MIAHESIWWIYICRSHHKLLSRLDCTNSSVVARVCVLLLSRIYMVEYIHIYPHITKPWVIWISLGYESSNITNSSVSSCVLWSSSLYIVEYISVDHIAIHESSKYQKLINRIVCVLWLSRFYMVEYIYVYTSQNSCVIWISRTHEASAYHELISQLVRARISMTWYGGIYVYRSRHNLMSRFNITNSSVVSCVCYDWQHFI